MEPPAADVPEDSPALIMYTSGTTGRPKGAVLTHENLMCQSLTLIRVWRLFADEEVNLCASPLFHIASIGAIAPMVLIGGTTVLLPSGGFSSAATLEMMEAERVTSVFLVPAQWQLLCDDASLASRDLSALKTMSLGRRPGHHDPAHPDGRGFSRRHQRGRVRPDRDVAGDVRAVRRGRAAQDRFGGQAGEHRGRADRRRRHEGRPARRGRRDRLPRPLGHGRVLAEPEATAEAFRGGWFHSGDLVRADEEGFLFVVDRKKDMIITGGENVYCAEVENALSAHPAVAELAVIGAPHERWGETPVAVAVLAPGASLTLDELRDWGTARLARYKLPTVLHIVDALPRNASGKVMKTALRQEYR